MPEYLQTPSPSGRRGARTEAGLVPAAAHRLFLGEYSTVACGDQAIGTNHVRCRSRAARYTGGLSVGKWCKCVTYETMSAAGTFAVAPTVAAICEAEMAVHALRARVRLERAADTASPTEGAHDEDR